MSVIVKGMKMPENCRECPFENYYSDTGKTVCMASLRVLATGFKTISFDGRPCSCPLVALPDTHGRLVDADALETDADYDDGDYWAYSVAQVCNAPTIVESEDSE